MESVGLGAASGAVAALVGLSFLALLWKRWTSAIWLPATHQWRPVGTLGKIYCYPVKSFKGLLLTEADCLLNGVHSSNGRDRAFAVVDGNGDFVSCKFHPQLLLIAPWVQGSKLTLKKADLPDLTIDFDEQVKKNVRSAVKLFKHDAPGFDMGDEISDWLDKAVLSDEKPEKAAKLRPLRLLYMPETLKRDMPHHAKNLPGFDVSHMVNYSGVTSYLIIGDGSIADLDTRMTSGIDERPFRPSIDIHGAKPYTEITWDYLKINGAIFRSVLACARCVAINTDPDRGEIREEKAYNVLKRYREEVDPNCVKFTGMKYPGPIVGQYFKLLKEGKVYVGDEVFAYP